MRVVSLAAGAGGMICGSCMRDNRLAVTLRSMGRDIVLLPLYTPIRTDEENASLREVRFGGINVYLEQIGIRRLPEWIARMLDAPALLRHVMRFSSNVRANSLGKLTVSILAGPEGAQRREIDRLIATLREIGPNLISLPNLMLLGAAGSLKRELGVPVVCTLSGEDIFLDQLSEPYRAQAFELIRQCANHVDAFISVTNYFADHAARHFSLPRERIHVVPMGIRVGDFGGDAGMRAKTSGGANESSTSEFTVGYLARISPEKGLANLCDAMIDLHRADKPIRVIAAGYLAKSDRAYLKAIQKKVERNGLEKSFRYLGEVTREQKIDLSRTDRSDRRRFVV
ncbi:MAG: glycosyltransferase family 4 protein [Planctomycetes bacterium]|nr:glycosyltransferase family 4 protein [Planctomycetota bacterium]